LFGGGGSKPADTRKTMPVVPKKTLGSKFESKITETKKEEEPVK